MEMVDLKWREKRPLLGPKLVFVDDVCRKKVVFDQNPLRKSRFSQFLPFFEAFLRKFLPSFCRFSLEGSAKMPFSHVAHVSGILRVPRTVASLRPFCPLFCHFPIVLA